MTLMQYRWKTRCAVDAIQVEDKVCGSDGVTYVNECVMRMTSCRSQIMIHAASLSQCGRNF